jgi:hypothetical protein
MDTDFENNKIASVKTRVSGSRYMITTAIDVAGKRSK